MATNSVNSFVSALRGGGARANQFMVRFPAIESSMGELQFYCRGAQIPAVTMGEVTIPYRGRQIFLPGDRTYDAWTITVFNDTDFTTRKAIENWQNRIANIGASLDADMEGEGVYRQAEVIHLDRLGTEIRTYTLYDVWPTTVDAIDLAFDTNDAIEEFGVTFRFNWMTIKGGAVGARGRGTSTASVNGNVATSARRGGHIGSSA